MSDEKPQQRYSEGSEWNKAWRYCPKCNHRSLVSDRYQSLDVPRFCPDCKTEMTAKKPMTEVLETKQEEAQWSKLSPD